MNLTTTTPFANPDTFGEEVIDVLPGRHGLCEGVKTTHRKDASTESACDSVLPEQAVKNLS